MSNSSPRAERLVDHVVETLLWVLLLLTPLLINVVNVDAYRTIQATFASCFAALTVGTWAVGLTLARRWREIARMPLLVPLGLFAAWLLMTAMRSPAPGMSLLSWLNLLLYAGVFMTIADLTSRRPETRGRLLVALLVPFALNSLAGILQVRGYDFLGAARSLGLSGSWLNYAAGLDAPAKLGSAAGMLGNQNVLGDYLVALVPVAFALAVTHRWRAIPFGIVGYLGLVALFASQTRGAWLATVIAGVLTLIVLAFIASRKFKHLTRQHFVPLGLVLLLGLGGALMAGGSFVFAAGNGGVTIAASFGKDNLVLKSLEKLSNVGTDRTSQQRLNAWDVAKLMADDRPLMGQGLGTYKIRYFSFLAKKYSDAPVPDMMQHRYVQAHNDFVQLAAETGYVGFLLGIGTLLAFLGGMLRFVWQRSLSGQDVILILGGLGGMTAMALSAIFGFPFHIAASSLAFAAVGGLVAGPWFASRREAETAPEAKGGPAWLNDAVLPIALGCFSLALVVAFYRPYQADMLIKQGTDLYQSRQIPQARAILEEAIALDGERGDARMMLGIIYTAYQEYPRSVQMLNQALRSYDDVTLHYYLGRVYEALSEFKLAQQHYERATRYFPPSTEIYRAVDERLRAVTQQLSGP